MNKMIVALLSVLTAIAVCLILNLSRAIVVPMVIALLIMQACQPILSLGKKIRLPQAANVVLVFVFIFLLFFIGVRLGISQLGQTERIFEQYGSKLTQTVDQLFRLFEIPGESLSIFSLLRRYLGNISGGVINFSSQFILTLVFLMFLLLEAPTLDRKLELAFPGSRSDTIKTIIGTISQQTGRYLGTMVIVSFATGFFVWASLAIVGVEFAAVWGVLAFILNFIPTIGSIIASIPPILLAAVQFGFTSPRTIAAAILVAFFQTFIGNVVAPKMLGDSLGLSPVVVMLSLLLWSLILGIPGAILSVPIASIIKIICENIPSLHPLAVLMGTPPRSG